MCHRASHLCHKIPSAQGLLGPLQRAEELGRGEVRGLGCCLERAFWLPAHTGLPIRQPTHRLPPSSVQWVSSPDPGQSPLDACQHRLLGPTPRVSDVVPKGQGLRVCISPSSQGMLLVQRAPSENPLSAGSHPHLHMRITRERFRLFPAPAPSQDLLVSREVWWLCWGARSEKSGRTLSGHQGPFAVSQKSSCPSSEAWRHRVARLRVPVLTSVPSRPSLLFLPLSGACCLPSSFSPCNFY